MERARGLAPHVVEHDDDGEVQRFGRHRWRDGCVAGRLPLRRRGRRASGRLRLAPPDRGAVDPFDRLVDAEPAEEIADRLRAGLAGAVVDDDDAADRDRVVHLGHRVDRVRVAAPDAQQRDLVDRRAGERVCRTTLQETHALVEEPEPGEAVADGVEIRPDVERVVGVLLDSEGVGDPDGLVVELVRLEIAADEDGGAAPTGSAIDQVARRRSRRGRGRGNCRR